MQRIIFGIFFLLTLGLIQTAFAEAPLIKKASFDANGKLHLKVKHTGEAGCYLIVNGGLASDKIDTAITSTTVTASQAQANSANINTKRKYYCKRRSLYVQIERQCFGEQVTVDFSEVAKVKVPAANIKK